MEPAILHVAIDSFGIQAERLRCPKLAGRPLVLAPSDSTRPRVVAASREARASGIVPGTPLVAARRLCRGLIAVPPDPDLYAGISESIRERLAPFAPFAEETTRAPFAYGRFALDLTGIGSSHAAARDRAAAAGSEVERAFRLHPTLGLGATRLVSRVAASVLAPDGELLDVLPGSEVAFLAPLAARVLPSARERRVLPRLELLALRSVGDIQALSIEQLRAAFGPASAGALWREARGLDGAVRGTSWPSRVSVAQERLSKETNDRRALVAQLARLTMELTLTLRARGVAARALAVSASYADGREGRARCALARPESHEATLRDRALSLLDRAVTRRVRVRAIRIEAWESSSTERQLTLWDEEPEREPGSGPCGEPGEPGHARALAGAIDRVRARFGGASLVPAAWLEHGFLRPSPRS